MGVDNFSITLDNPTYIYRCGETVSGYVILKIAGTETTTEITVQFSGSSNTTFRNQHNSKAIHRGYQQLFCFKSRLFGDGHTKTSLSEGDHVLPFSFQVPRKQFPPNVRFNYHDGKIAKVTYGLQCSLKKPWYVADVKTKFLPVSIRTSTDLNLIRGAANSKRVTIRENFFHFCCLRSKPCYLQSHSSRLGFCPGEVVSLAVTVYNTSAQRIVTLTATLEQKWTLFDNPRNNSSTHWTPLHRMEHSGDIPIGEEIQWDVSFTIPPTAPPTSNFDPRGIIKLEYFIIVGESNSNRLLFTVGQNSSLSSTYCGLDPITSCTVNDMTSSFLPRAPPIPSVPSEALRVFTPPEEITALTINSCKLSI